MNILNIFGLIIMIVIMIPNIVYEIKEKNFENKYHNKVIEITEQIGRFGSMFLMIINIPLLEYGYWFSNAKLVYMIIISVLTLLYCFIWILYSKNTTLSKAMALAIIPTLIFLISGILLASILLIITALFFGIGHITITLNNNK
ncbi:MAG: hypothetical protein ACRC3H_01090 [Lachnospiraceae bacterium]